MKETFETIFYGSEEERFYHEAGADMGYMEDTGNHDVRTEGMSYGMMVCVQMNRKKNLTVYGNGYGRICISRMVREKIILPGRVLSMVQETRTDRHRMEKNILQWRSFCFKEMGRWRRHFRLQQRGKSNFTGMCP